MDLVVVVSVMVGGKNFQMVRIRKPLLLSLYKFSYYTILLPEAPIPI